VLFLSNPPGVSQQVRRSMLDDVRNLNQLNERAFNDPEISARVDQYEMAFRMQTAVPDLADLSKEPDSVYERYGPESKKPGSFAANCILARRLAERGVRFIQLYHRGWDQHGNLPAGIKSQCHDTDQPTGALLSELKERGLFEDTLVIWGGEFGRTVYSQGTLTRDNYGRDHHPRCFSIFMAGAGIRGGHIHGETDDFSYNIVRDPVHIHDLNATAMHLLGLDHTQLTYRFQGRDYRLTDIHGSVVRPILT
jgi:arylsulfatase A-like enzyme